MKIELLAKKGAIRLLRALSKKKELKFAEIQKLIGSPTTASQRLKELEGMGVVRREVQADRYRSVRYSLTDKGRRIVKFVDELEQTR